MTKDICCSDPRIIINPSLPALLSQYKHTFLFGHHHYYSTLPHITQIDLSRYSVKRNGVTIENYSDHLVIDDETGNTFPIYLCVPCGHCDLCKVNKVNSFVSRCRLETQAYNCKPWFVTLTYDNKHLPVDGVSIRDVQLFLKRLRINLQRNDFPFLIRYVAVGEYGKNTHRPHYHLIIWNIDVNSHEQVRAVHMLIRSSWSQGYIQSRLVNPDDDRGFFYTAKYVKKDCDVPSGKNPTFLISSRGHGGIGAPFIDKCSSDIRRSLNVTYQYRDKFSGKLTNFPWCSYVINRIFPTFCKSVSSSLRQSIYYSQLYLDCLSRYVSSHPLTSYFKNVYSYCEKFLPIFSNFFSIRSLSPVDYTKKMSFQAYDVLDYCLSDCKRVIDSLLPKVDFKLAKSLDILRSRFLGRLFEFQKDLNLRQKLVDSQWILYCESPRTIHV